MGVLNGSICVTNKHFAVDRFALLIEVRCRNFEKLSKDQNEIR
jgi:hypothetical protein